MPIAINAAIGATCATLRNFERFLLSTPSPPAAFPIAAPPVAAAGLDGPASQPPAIAEVVIRPAEAEPAVPVVSTMVATEFAPIFAESAPSVVAAVAAEVPPITAVAAAAALAAVAMPAFTLADKHCRLVAL
jgi:hypothetical protein